MAELPADYQKLRALEKRALLWERIEQSAYPADALPSKGHIPFVLNAACHGLMSIPYLKKTFLHPADELPKHRTKIIHTYGSVCGVKLVPVEGQPYSGIFSSGAIGLLRISLALPARSFTPGIGVKLFIDGHPSVNTVAMHSLKGQGDDCNVFSESNDNPASAEFAGLPMRILYYFFKRTADALKADAPRMEWFYMPFDEWGRWRADGTEESEVHCPYGVSFAPAEAQTSRDKTPDFRLKLRQIEAGTRLFRVMAFDANEAKAQKHIGDMISTTPFVASSYGDQKLFFQHLKGDPG